MPDIAKDIVAVGLQVIDVVVFTSSLWLPIAFVIFLIARRRYGLGTLLLFVTLEALAFGLTGWWLPLIFVARE